MEKEPFGGVRRRRRKRRYSPPQPLAMDVTSIISISKCIQELLKLQSRIIQTEEFLETGSLEKELEVILDIKSNVVHLFKIIFEETDEGIQNPSSCNLAASSYVFSTIFKIIQELMKMQRDILQRGESLDKEEVLRIKSSVVKQLEMLFMDPEEAESEEADDEPMDVDTDPTAGGSMGLVSIPVQGEESFWQEEFTWSSVDGSKVIEEKERYLCLSNGFEIWCLDLAKSKRNAADLPKIDTLDLVGGPLPASVGLFKLGSDAYMIGGQHLPASVSDSVPSCGWGEKLQGIDLYHSLLFSYGLKGSSCVTYRLSLAADKDDHDTLSLSCTESENIEVLKHPKVWPIVETIGEKLHVMDSVPPGLMVDPCWVFSHEVKGGGGSWEEIMPADEKDEIASHVVVGNRIYAVANSESGECFLELDDSRMPGRWEGHADPLEWLWGMKVKRVWDILTLGIARCVGAYKCSEADLQLYVLVAIMPDKQLRPDGAVGRRAVAFLVTLTGEVVCYQHLPDFFAGPLQQQPCNMGGGTMIHVEDEVKEWGTMCSVINATLELDGRNRDYIFINTFSLGVLDDSADKVKKLLDGPPPAAVESEFVSFTPKDWYIFEADDSRHGSIDGWRACFLTPSRPF